MEIKKPTVCVVGLGYVGLPLTYHFALAGAAQVHAFDIDVPRVVACANGLDHTDMVPRGTRLMQCDNIKWSAEMPVGCDVYVICVPTPDKHGIPDYSYVDAAVSAVLSSMRPDSALVLESTVAPGTIRERIKPMLARYGISPDVAQLAYSPERVNPGPFAFGEMARCTKVIGVDNTTAAHRPMMQVYRATFDDVLLVDDTRIPELAKCFENMQRDVNIALMNELSMICHREGVSYSLVVEALQTKLTSPKFTSGLVGGHCIPVDPYYLAAYYDDVAPARVQLPIVGRDINEEYIDYVALLAHKENAAKQGTILIYGATYKPNVKDTRNSGALKIAERLRNFGNQVVVYDPLVYPEIGLDDKYTVIVGAVLHNLGNPDVWDYIATIDCTFINVGGAFPASTIATIKNIINV